MGLDISVFVPQEKVDNLTENEYGVDYDTALYSSPDIIEVFNQNDGIEDGEYKGEWLDSFRAGSYSGYGAFRRWLANFVGFDLEQVGGFNNLVQTHMSRIKSGKKGVPFVELIYFSDCEGFIGPKTSAKLYRDFEKMERKLNLSEVFAEDQEEFDWFRNKYNDWKNAFELAANNNGVVIFH